MATQAEGSFWVARGREEADAVDATRTVGIDARGGGKSSSPTLIEHNTRVTYEITPANIPLPETPVKQFFFSDWRKHHISLTLTW